MTINLFDSKCNILYIFKHEKHEKVVLADLHSITSNYLIPLSDFQRGDITSPSVVTLQASHRCGEDATSKRRGTSITLKETSVKQERCFIQPSDPRRVYKSDFTVLSVWLQSLKEGPPPLEVAASETHEGMNLTCQPGAPCSRCALLCPPPSVFAYPKKKQKKPRRSWSYKSSWRPVKCQTQWHLTSDPFMLWEAGMDMWIKTDGTPDSTMPRP